MMKKTILFVAVLFINSVTVFGQEKYNGGFNTHNFSGTSTYFYSDVNNERIYNGDFYFTTDNGGVKINGKYKNNYKNGYWIFEFSNNKTSNFINVFKTTASVSGNFVEGNLEGKWTLSRTIFTSFTDNAIVQQSQAEINEMAVLMGGETLDFSQVFETKEAASVHFKNNHFSDTFFYKKDRKTISGQFDDNGYFDGDWIIKKYENNILITITYAYKHGILSKIDRRNDATGRVEVLVDTVSFANSFLNNFDAATKYSIIDGKYYTYKDDLESDIYNDDLKDAIHIWYNSGVEDNSAYIFEVKHGGNQMSIYPNRVIYFDSEKTEEEKRKRDAFVKDSILVEKRKNVEYSLKLRSPEEFVKLRDELSILVEDKLLQFDSNDLYIKAKIIFRSDTLGKKSFVLEDVDTDNQEFLEIINRSLENYSINSIVEGRYKFNTYAEFSMNYTYTSKEAILAFRIKEKNGNSNYIYEDTEPSKFLKSEIEKHEDYQREGKYEINYKITRINDNPELNLDIIKFKEKKHWLRGLLNICY